MLTTEIFHLMEREMCPLNKITLIAQNILHSAQNLGNG